MQAHPLFPYSGIIHSVFSLRGDLKNPRDYHGHQLVIDVREGEHRAHQIENLVNDFAGEFEAGAFDIDEAISGRCVD